MRYFEAVLTDNDGEEHSYQFSAPSVWAVAAKIAATMEREGDFYGHKHDDTMNLSIVELTGLYADRLAIEVLPAS